MTLQLSSEMGVFAGRRRELAELRAALAGGSRLVLVAGDAGIGKTRFVTEGLRGTQVRGAPACRWPRSSRSCR